MSLASPWSRWSRAPALVVGVAVLYLLTARVGLAWAMPPEMKATAVWAPSGIALAALLVVGRHLWPGVWVGSFAANFWDAWAAPASVPLGIHAAVSAGIATGSTLQAALGAVLLQRLLQGGCLLDRARNAARFVAIAPLMCLVSATIGVSTLAQANVITWSHGVSTWWTWWLGDTVGVLLVTPLFTVSREMPSVWSRRRLLEAAALLGLILGVGWLVFGHSGPWKPVTVTLTYLTAPLLVWATFRFGEMGAKTSLLLASAIAIAGTIQGHGPFVRETLNDSLLMLQSFLGVLAVTVLALAGALAERRHADRSKAVLIEHLADALNEIKTIRGLIPICAWCKSIRNDEGSWERLEGYLQGHTEAELSHGICPDCLRKRSAPDDRPNPASAPQRSP